MFRRPHHQRIATLLASLDTDGEVVSKALNTLASA